MNTPSRESFMTACEASYGGYHYNNSSNQGLRAIVVCTKYSTFRLSIEKSNFVLLHKPNYSNRYHRQLTSDDVLFLLWCAYTHDLGKYNERRIYRHKDYEKFLKNIVEG